MKETGKPPPGSEASETTKPCTQRTRSQALDPSTLQPAQTFELYLLMLQACSNSDVDSLPSYSADELLLAFMLDGH